MQGDEVQTPEIDRQVVADGTDDSDPSTNETDALLWLELADGATREALVERLAQAHLFDPTRAPDDSAFTARRRPFGTTRRARAAGPGNDPPEQLGEWRRGRAPSSGP